MIHKSRTKSPLFVYLLFMFTIALYGCQQTQSNPTVSPEDRSEPGETSGLIPTATLKATQTDQPQPTETAEPTENPHGEMTRANLIGAWQMETNWIVFKEDGTWTVGSSASLAESAPLDWGTFSLEEDLLTLESDPQGGCDGETGIYEVIPTGEDEALFMVVSEGCSERGSDLGGEPCSREVP